MIHREQHDSVALLRIEHGKVQALDLELCCELAQVFEQVFVQVFASVVAVVEVSTCQRPLVQLLVLHAESQVFVELFRQ